MKKITTYFGMTLLCAVANGATLAGGWDSSLDLGLTMTQGNSETTLLTTNLNLSKSEANDEYLAGLGYTFGEDSGNVSADELTGFFSWNRLVSETQYAGFRLEGRRDDIAKVDYRIQATALYGIYLIKNDTTTFSIEGGPGYTTQSLDSVDSDSAHFYVGQKASHKLTENTNLTQSIAAYAQLEDFDNHNINFTFGIETRMSEAMSLKILVENKYESEPAAGAENNDLKLVSGISYKF